MKAKELMIGDWVMPHNCTSPSIVAGVTPNKVHTWWADGTKHAKDEYYFEPIPLTPEILEKNGFEKWSAQYRYRVLKPNTTIDKSIHFTLMIDGEHICEVRNYNATRAEPRYYNVVRYVHELQHALRLCGLNELADNFKV